MKKCLFVAVIAATVFAASAKAQFSIGVGYANEKVISKTSVLDLGTGIKGYSWEKSRTHLDGFYVEASYDWEFTEMGPGVFTLQPGVRYTMLTSLISSTKSRASKDGEKYSASSQSRYNNHLLDIPVNVKYSYDFVPGTVKAYVFAGPVLSLGLVANNVLDETYNVLVNGKLEKQRVVETCNVYNGKYIVKTYNQETKKYDVEKQQDDLYKLYNAFDLKFGLGAGVTLCEEVDIKFGYNIGLLNRSFIKKDDLYKYSAHSNIMYFGVAYNF
jgi:hypothetical protein